MYPEKLSQVDEGSLRDMRPGDILLLNSPPRAQSETDGGFFAVLACPACGALGLISPPQYFGSDPVICSSDECSCRFRIVDRSRLHFLPVI